MRLIRRRVIQRSAFGKRSWSIPAGLLLWMIMPGFCAAQDDATAPAGATQPGTVQGEALSAWQFMQPVSVREIGTDGLVDFILTPGVFDGARVDLGDLRLYDTEGQEIPYALRVRTPREATQEVDATRFNDVEGTDKTNLVSFDLGDKVIEHNEVQIKTDGNGFRRRVFLEGSSDGEEWSVLADDTLLNFGEGERKLVQDRIAYSPCRLRYLRITLHRDPVVDKRLVQIRDVVVRRRIEVPGEYVTRNVTFGERAGVKTQSGPGSAWFVDLEGQHNPCERLHVDIADAEFARDFFIEAATPPAPRSSPWFVTSGQWQRRAGEKIEPMTAGFPEQRAARLRLSITDHRNPVLSIEAMRVTAVVRQVVFEPSAEITAPVYLYYGNPKASAPNYDIAKNLPVVLSPPPRRAELEPRQDNPSYVPEPLPLTERLPWLIYVLLGLTIAVLGVLIASLARAAITGRDTPPTSAPAEG